MTQNYKKAFVCDLKEAIINKLGIRNYAHIIPEKISQFQESSNEHNISVLQALRYFSVAISEEQKDKDLRLTVSGARTLMTKSAFIDNDISHLNYDTVFASQIARTILKIYTQFIFSTNMRCIY